MQPPFHKTFYFKTADFADKNVKSLLLQAKDTYIDAGIYFAYEVWDRYCEMCSSAAVWQNAANWEGPNGAAEKARWFEEESRCDLTEEELDAFQDTTETFKAYERHCHEHYEWPDLFIRHHLQEFFNTNSAVGGELNGWWFEENAETWKLSCNTRDDYVFFLTLFAAIAQESGTTFRFYCDGMMFEITPGVPMPPAPEAPKPKPGRRWKLRSASEEAENSHEQKEEDSPF